MPVTVVFSCHPFPLQDTQVLQKLLPTSGQPHDLDRTASVPFDRSFLEKLATWQGRLLHTEGDRGPVLVTKPSGGWGRRPRFPGIIQQSDDSTLP
jgi:hypothetical protein